MQFENTLAFARKMDKADPLRSFRKEFYIPKVKGKDAIYLCGNSLGLQPKAVEKHVMTEIEDWRRYGVEGHLHARNPWLYYHHLFTKPLANLVGAKKDEVVCMNNLTVNLNLMMVTFYRPSGSKTKIVIEGSAFPSDYYAVEQQIRFHGLKAEDNIIELLPREGEVTLRTEDILDTLTRHKDEIALVLLGGVNYYSGQFFDIKSISDCCRKNNLTLGLDLAHAIGNVELKLHDWNIDFATWCSYKYLNSGPGGVSGVFVHNKYAKRPDLPRFAGWWGNDEKTRFKMEKRFVPQEGAAGWQMSNAPIMNMAAHKASLELFEKAGIKNLRKKSVQLTAYLEYLLQPTITGHQSPISIITPSDPRARGCQLSLQTKSNGKKIFDKLTKAGVIADWREPDVIRIAPVPLYNSFEDVWRFADILSSAVKSIR
ncbi:MAG: kynureninase [Bacteroidetes bacterium]|nr:kynureninase [Bacteroidota bacterium]